MGVPREVCYLWTEFETPHGRKKKYVPVVTGVLAVYEKYFRSVRSSKGDLVTIFRILFTS